LKKTISPNVAVVAVIVVVVVIAAIGYFTISKSGGDSEGPTDEEVQNVDASLEAQQQGVIQQGLDQQGGAKPPLPGG